MGNLCAADDRLKPQSWRSGTDQATPKKNPDQQLLIGVCIKSLAVSYFHMGTPTLSSALSGFTSEFGMGSGGSRSLLPPGKLVGSMGSDSIDLIDDTHAGTVRL